MWANGNFPLRTGTEMLKSHSWASENTTATTTTVESDRNKQMERGQGGIGARFDRKRAG